jgi:hypothetical protein
MTITLAQPIIGTLSEQIQSKLADFDLLALLRLLKMEGYESQNFWFSSHESLSSQDRLIAGVTLINERALISINLGLLGVHSPLPSAVFQQLDKAAVKQRSLSDFLKFFDHLLILNYLGNLYPQINTEFFSDWEKTNFDYLQVQNMHSKSSLFWLFQVAYPEFDISLSNDKFIDSSETESIYLGRLILGDESHFGGESKFSKPSIHIHLRLMCEDFQPNLNWAKEALKRLDELIYPLLNGLEVCLKITFSLGEHSNSLHLLPTSSLGYEALQTTELKALQLCLHQGMVRLPTTIPIDDIEWGVPCRIQV